MEEKKLMVLYADRLSQLITKANKEGVTKEEIVDIIKDFGQFMMVYYR